MTGATGTVGGQVARLLSGRHPLRLLGRSPERLRALGLAAEAVGADFGDRRSLERALAGAHALFAVTVNPLEPGHDENLLAAARSAGVRHVVKLSALAVTDHGADDLITRWQRRNEDLLRGSGLAWTILRPRAFMSNTLAWAATIRSGGVVAAPQARSRNASVDPRDVAEAAVLALTEPGHEGRHYPLTGPESISAVEQCEQLAEVLGRPLSCVGTSLAQAYAAWARRYPESIAQALLDSAKRQGDGAKQQVDHTLGALLGRPPGTYRRWARDHAHHFK
ncbi:NAD(P)H-binding protein [Streptomyces rubradiris]|uniref:NAD(P)H-binding protein n=1 Tax=Streptomyces rubradiris TaxID=285531 RepID=UPI0027E5306E|nr:NAD(P)H-binding protein [Streptomyces rubradiris]